jgi:hypothetical protein
MKSWSDEERRSIAAQPYRDRERAAGRLPASGRAHDRVFLERNRDYPADSDLCFEIGNSVTRVRLTGFDLHRLRGLLLDQGGGLEVLYERAGRLQAEAAPLSQFRDLVDAAHAAGYQLCAEDHRADARTFCDILESGQVLSSPAELARWVEVHHGDHPEWVSQLRSLLPAADASPAAQEPGSVLADLRLQALDVGNVPAASDRVPAFLRLVDRAYIAGQAASGKGALRDYLLALAEGRDGEALERVISMLES